ncbi:MAG TPA: mechanosensitive ion channel domain-containing protein [Chthoniobacterales bacterium]|nr:mechanosensitive ion channel domain-containing protein [Chthoniobacterales bacterium]
MNLPWLKDPIFNLAGHHITILGVAAFVGLFLLGLIIARLIQSAFVRRLLSRFKLDSNFVAIMTTILSAAAIVFFTVSAINGLGIPLAWTAPIPGIPISLLQIFLLIALLFFVFWISSRTKRFLFNRFLVHSGLDRSLQYAISQIVSNVILVVGVFIVLQNTGIHLEALTVFAGAVGVGVGFGLQNITSNFISGLVILAERPIAIGDRVQVAGVTGQVRKIRARSTVVVTNDNIATIVPNQKFIDSPVTNWTWGDPKVRFRIPVGVAYGSDMELVRAKLIEVADENPHTLKDPAPNVYFKEFGDSSLNLELVAWSDEMSHRPSRFRSDLNFAIDKKFREAGIEVPFPQRDLNIRSGVLQTQTTDAREEQEPSES